MEPRTFLRNNWRILVLLVLVGASVYFLFVPGAPITGAAAEADGTGESTTNLQYGIELQGGAQVIAPVHGLVADDVPISDPDSIDETQAQAAEVEAAVADAMNISTADVRTYTFHDDFDEEDVVEVLVEGDPEAFAAGLQDAGYDVTAADIDPGVTRSTREDIIEVLDVRLGEAGFGGGEVTERDAGEPRIMVTAPGQTREELREQISFRGAVETIIHHPADNEQGFEREVLLRNEDIERFDPVSVQDGGPGVPVTLTEEAAARYVDRLQATGFADNPRACISDPETDEPQPGSYCFISAVDGEILWSGGIAPGLAEEVQTERFLTNPQFRITTNDLEEAQDLRLNLIAGELPADLNLEGATEQNVGPALAEDFRQNSLVTGLLAILAVVVMIFLRYGDIRVALPMSVTALSELVILLGFAAATGYTLNLPEVAGFIVVVGTGVDDLIIIADEILDEGEVKSGHVFESRFRRAFWVIGAAAATAIVAMSPLAILEVGDLRGFAIITILGVLIGVTITRPAYGNILRSLKTDGR